MHDELIQVRRLVLLLLLLLACGRGGGAGLILRAGLESTGSNRMEWTDRDGRRHTDLGCAQLRLIDGLVLAHDDEERRHGIGWMDGLADGW